ncbi:MAG TPA: thiol peroxidase [Candidatus Limnocylindria bacterium]|jgi:thiol peroxidase|nr:thiol peroxidase [Candidatus Limnocylindria bacterium]
MTTQSSTERAGAVTFKGNPMTLVGPEVRVGEPAPEFALTTKDLQRLTLEEAIDDGARAALLIVVPSLDTSVCALETQTFHQRVGELPEGVAAFVVSMDLPFAQQRWANANGATGLNYLSDYRERSFGPAYGVLIKELGLLARSVFVIGRDRMVAYANVVKEVTEQPDYDAVFAAVKSLR